jgi:hypothetical protein
LTKNITDIPFDRSAPELCMGKLIAVTSEATVAARILATLAISLHALVRRFKAHPEYAGILDIGDEPGAARHGIIKDYDRKSC